MNGAEINAIRMSEYCPKQCFADARSIVDSLFQFGATSVDEIEANVRSAAVVGNRTMRFFRKRHCVASDLLLGKLGAFGKPFYDVPVTISRSEVHRRVSVDWVLREDWVNLTDAFKELFPIERRQEAHACDDVPYGDLVRRLPL